MDDLILLLGDQLFDDLSRFPLQAPIWMREDWGLASRFRHHRRKLVLFFSAMRHTAEGYRRLGRTVHYQALPHQDQRSLPEALAEFCRENGVQRVHTFRPHDRFFGPELRDTLDRNGISLEEHDSPAFLTRDEDWAAYAKASKRRLMNDFYIRQRRRLNVLIDDQGEPVGGQWSFDHDNRKPVPKALVAPQPKWVPPDAMTQEVIDLVDEHFPGHPGRAAGFALPVTHLQAATWLDDFLQTRFAEFGPYEDAIVAEQDLLWHSLLSPLINIGLVTPLQVLRAAERADVPLASKEGFIRQIIGWREFIKRIDEEYAPRQMGNPFGHHRRLGPPWWTGETGLPPIDRAIRRCIEHGWTHHIERLMILGAPMLMAEVDPDDAYRWFMEMFIDSADWVMAPNVYGMSQFADGGYFATKPYISGSSYVLKMSDYAKGPWCEVWDGLYWRFILKHKDEFVKNPRMATIARSSEKLDPLRRDRIVAAAEEWIDRVTTASSRP